jgi:AcrR family transcriptional regulator
MLKANSYRELKVIDIAREAKTSPATFYQYFPDVQAAILALAEEMANDVADLAAFVRDASWKGRAGYEVAEALADRFLRHWDEHRAILRVVDLAAGEGDGRFTQIRVRMLNGVTVALDEVIRHRQGDVKGARDSMATAGVLVAMLAHVSAHRYGFEFWGIRTTELRRTMADIVYWSVTAQKPPS